MVTLVYSKYNSCYLLIRDSCSFVGVPRRFAVMFGFSSKRLRIATRLHGFISADSALHCLRHENLLFSSALQLLLYIIVTPSNRHPRVLLVFLR